MANINERDGFQSSFYNDESSFYNAQGGDQISAIAGMLGGGKSGISGWRGQDKNQRRGGNLTPQEALEKLFGEGKILPPSNEIRYIGTDGRIRWTGTKKQLHALIERVNG